MTLLTDSLKRRRPREISRDNAGSWCAGGCPQFAPDWGGGAGSQQPGSPECPQQPRRCNSLLALFASVRRSFQPSGPGCCQLARLALSDRRGVLSSSGIGSFQNRSSSADQCRADLGAAAIPCELCTPPGTRAWRRCCAAAPTKHVLQCGGGRRPTRGERWRTQRLTARGG